MNEEFDTCNHKWKFNKSAEGGFYPAPTLFSCLNCNKIITLQEKSALDQIIDTQKSLRIQEDSLNIAKKAMIISAIAMTVSVVGLWLEKILN